MNERYIASGSAMLWTEASAKGIPLVLANGGPGCCDYLAPVASMLKGMAQVIRFEGRG